MWQEEHDVSCVLQEGWTVSETHTMAWETKREGTGMLNIANLPTQVSVF